MQSLYKIPTNFSACMFSLTNKIDLDINLVDVLTIGFRVCPTSNCGLNLY